MLSKEMMMNGKSLTDFQALTSQKIKQLNRMQLSYWIGVSYAIQPTKNGQKQFKQKVKLLFESRELIRERQMILQLRKQQEKMNKLQGIQKMKQQLPGKQSLQNQTLEAKVKQQETRNNNSQGMKNKKMSANEVQQSKKGHYNQPTQSVFGFFSSLFQSKSQSLKLNHGKPRDQQHSGSQVDQQQRQSFLQPGEFQENTAHNTNTNTNRKKKKCQ